MPEADRRLAGDERHGWFVQPKFVELGCPICKRSVVVIEGLAWCTRCPGRPEMSELAT